MADQQRQLRHLAARHEQMSVKIEALAATLNAVRSGVEANASQLKQVRQLLDETQRLTQENTRAIEHVLQAELLIRRDLDAQSGQMKESQN